MKPHAHKYSIFLVCSLFLVAVPVLLMWRTWRQVKLDQALIKAVYNSQAQEVRVLLEAGADPNARVSRKAMPTLWQFITQKFHGKSSGLEELPETPLFVAVQKEGSEYPVDEEPEHDKPQYEPMKTDIVRALLQYGARTEDKSPNTDITPLIEAARNGRFRSVQALLEAGADVNAHDAAGKTVLMYSAAEESVPLLECLLAKGANVSARDNAGATPLSYAAHESNFALVTLLLARGAGVNIVAKNSMTAFLEAGQWGDGRIMGLMLAHGADIHARTKEGHTALHLVAASQSSEPLRLMLQKGADPNVSDRTGETPLMSACGRGNAESVRLLLAHGANVNARALNGDTALVDAVGWGESEQVRLLLAHHADSNIRDQKGRTLIQMVKYLQMSKHNHCSPGLIRLLKQAGSKE